MNLVRVAFRRPGIITRTYPVTKSRQLHIYPHLLKEKAKSDSSLLRTSFLTLCTVGLLGSAYYEYNYHGVRRYPSNIRSPLRKALLYHKYKEDPVRALPYYEQAVDLALKSPQLEDTSSEVTGLIIQFGTFYEDQKNWEKAIEVYTKAFDLLVSENKETSIDEVTYERLNSTVTETPLAGEKLIRAVGIAQKLGELYEKIHARSMAEKYYVWAVERLLRHRVVKSDSEKLPSGRYFELPEWITPTEIGASLESLAMFYAMDGKYNYAIPLYIRALSTLNETHCHASVIMCNISEAFANMGQYKEAQAWARKGLDVARLGRDDKHECDQSCGVLLYNIGMIYEMSGQTDGAMKYYTQSMNHARKIGYKECQREAAQALDHIRRKQTGLE
ncbi:hypothetical protein K493DRAFT_276124 [Basidiobolus meristosporus CBS 931.73]|uniref:TPR-like protein n=1 Tax=Basidiobolus meristosporus CBS 931.73 TaxID=1314790 RepID=A0A1Y1Z1C7_9FUNG|nr:hypothetical protein K493DRAFT_276124 [Basidiobolus meristosporus CBS 931.73]|eukprot:ORY04103.1 hypothetical protein K493DRAFT_276124 [Basidiobolus meristosporus CBS 931.73]